MLDLELGVFLGPESICMVGPYHGHPSVEDFHRVQAISNHHTAFLLWWEFLFLVELKISVGNPLNSAGGKRKKAVPLAKWRCSADMCWHSGRHSMAGTELVLKMCLFSARSASS